MTRIFCLRTIPVIVLLIVLVFAGDAQNTRSTLNFNSGWKFYLGDAEDAEKTVFNDNSWRHLSLPHDWSIEGSFDKNNPAGTGGGALPGGIGWYRKTFTLPASAKDKNVFIDFDGVYRNSEVWINDHYLGKRPNGYISFRYDLSPWLKPGNEKNVIAVKVDNAQQPNSRWYSGAGIYRNVWLVVTAKSYVAQWGTYITTTSVNDRSASVAIHVKIHDLGTSIYKTIVYDSSGKMITSNSTVPFPPGTPKRTGLTGERTVTPVAPAVQEWNANFYIPAPHLWSIESPYLYKAVTQVIVGGKVIDEYATSFGIRTFVFDKDKGFLLNGKHVKINGVCNHHDLGCLGSAVNTRTLQRQLQLLKAMGCNGIRTSHNPPAPELLDLCDRMGFIVMDEAFDMWKKEKNPYDYHLDWDAWHETDLKDQIIRDRNHPSVFIWSIGNEVNEQYDPKDSSGAFIARELAAIVRSLDTTRPITSALNNPYPQNPVIYSGALDLIGYNYDHKDYATFHQRFPGKKFIATETVSALATRGYYDMPSDSIRRWPKAWDKPFEDGNANHTVSAYDNVSAPWGSTHEETWKVMKQHDFLSGQYIWTGFDYLGEPTPYGWPSRSSYFGIIDLAGFPKDVYYMYRSEWTNQPVLHIFPHWNWEPGRTVDVWAYYNNADEVELFLNGKSLGTRKKEGDELHVMWRVTYQPGELRAISRSNGKTVLVKTIQTAGRAAKIELVADRRVIAADGSDLSFITVKITDAHGNVVPLADNEVQFTVKGQGVIAGVDNGSETSMESFKAPHRKAFNGLCLLVVQSTTKAGNIVVTARADGLINGTATLQVK